MTGMKIIIEAEATGPVPAELFPDRAPNTVAAIQRALPIVAVARRWGEEVYFEIPVEAAPESPTETVTPGDIGYWPPGRAFCIFFGPTPASRHRGEVRPASPVNPIGRVLSDASVFGKVRAGDRITVRPA